ncbi:pimeloyl-ACP methyl ester carboxylesterase [Sagittula marina]|uniref:Pimeloyl-ACP methyl ester carboxylesterase n=1 Tax=Sagittula marina TaxID=943940 RepID=A0A7W6DPK2_9RHOB|nr:alpha/beta fold hydrolase [Sagittula marina]MBB3984375.1 pimeloyl-ACP methyl ester carboxylesterase [Sagittula marina]
MTTNSLTFRASPLLAILAALAAAPSQAQEVGAFEPTPCPILLPHDGEVEGETYDCGIVVVPENHETDGGRTIEIAAMRLRATTLSPRSDPVIYLAGGPGSSGLHEFAANPTLFQNMQAMRQRRDVIAFDQRGTGHSQVLACGPFFAGIGVVGEMFDEVNIADLEEIVEGRGAMSFIVAVCGMSYASVGVDLGQYNSVASAKDIAMLADAMGYGGSYNVYGTSYGTRLAQHALRTTPQRLRAAIMDGTVSVSEPGNAHTSSKLQTQYDTIFELCAADAFCAKRFPDLRARFIALLEELSTDPLVLDPPLVGSDFFRNGGFVVEDRIDVSFFNRLGVFNNGAGRGGAAAFVPMLIQALEDRNTDYLRDIMGRGTLPDQLQVCASPDATDVFKPDDSLIAPSVNLILQLAEASLATESGSLSADWLGAVVGELNARLHEGETQAKVIRDLVELSLVPLQPTDASALVEFADAHLSPGTVVTVNALANAMDRQQVRETFWTIQDIAERMSGVGERSGVPGVAMGMLNAVNCAEDVGFFPPEVAEEFVARTPYPGIGVQSVDTYRVMYAACGLLPSPFTQTEITAPVQSDTPVLIFSEGMDSQTPVTQGELVAETLPNSILHVWSSEGHVIASRSPDGCAGAIAAAFLDDPMTRPDVSCAQDDYYRIPFDVAYELVLGDGEDRE